MPNITQTSHTNVAITSHKHHSLISDTQATIIDKPKASKQNASSTDNFSLSHTSIRFFSICYVFCGCLTGTLSRTSVTTLNYFFSILFYQISLLSLISLVHNISIQKISEQLIRPKISGYFPQLMQLASNQNTGKDCCKTLWLVLKFLEASIF